MDEIIIRGGKPLAGEISISGAKNSALKLIAASLLTDQEVILRNVPRISDVDIMLEVIAGLGARVAWESDGALRINAGRLTGFQADYDLVSQMRASVIVIGPMVARLGQVRVAMPGGCQIGSRKIDLHIHGLENLGAVITLADGCIGATASRLHGAEIRLAFPSVGATENLLMAATLASGRTVIENAAREPEIVDIADFLIAMGADIKGAGTTSIVIDGVKTLRGCDYTVMPDRIEAGTFMMAVAACGGSAFLKKAQTSDLGIVVEKLRHIGATIEGSADGVRISRDRGLRSVSVSTLPYPGFPTDLQAPIMAVLSLADGASVLTENVFENRYAYVEELRKLGSSIRVEGHHAIIEGPVALAGGSVSATDLRAGAGLVVAALAAEGTSRVGQVYHIDRGYENLIAKLRSLGADIERNNSTRRRVGVRAAVAADKQAAVGSVSP